MHFTEEEKQLLIKFLLLTANSDGTFSNDEKHFILNALQQLGMRPEEIDVSEASDYQLPESERVRMTMLYYLLFLIKSDHDISSEEIEMVTKLGLQMGFRVGMVEQMVEIMKEHINRDMPKDALLEAVKAYLN